MSYHPLRDFVVVNKEVATEAPATPGGLIFRPATAESKVVKGSVVAVGSGRVSLDGTVVPLEVKVGDVVLFNKSMAVELDDGTCLLREDQLLCVVK